MACPDHPQHAQLVQVMTQPPLPDSVPPAERRMVRCLRCGRPLLDAESRLYELGPECRAVVPLTPRGWVVEQDALPGLESPHHPGVEHK